MSTVQVPAGQRLVLSGIDWRTYGRLLRAFDERPGVRLTYDRGVLEIMTLSPEHERFKHLLRRLIEALAEEMGLTIAGFGSMTFRRRRRRRGLEADECFWIANEPRVRGKDRIDLRVDPPPDLVVEVDVSRSSLDRLAIYASLGVPEVWRFAEQALTFHVLGTNGRYSSATHSPSFPLVTPADVTGFLALRGQLDEIALVRHVRAWVRQRLNPSGAAPTNP
jgi:Uma2 family endonuclease